MRGDDSLFGDAGDDTFSIYSTFGNDTIIGSETGETTGDTLDFTYAGGVTVDLSALDPEAGTFTDGTSISSFIEIENILLGNGRDTVILADGSGADAVQAFDMADSGDGTTNDQLDVSGLTSDGGTTPVTTADVTVTANGDGDAVLTFTGGESITLIGVSPSQLDTYAELEAIGIPGQSANFIVEGSSGDDIIDVNYTNDPGGDLVDANDHSDGSHSDVIESYQGNDSIDAGLGNDTVWAGADDDFVDGGVGADIIYGEGGSDTLYGGDGNDVVRGGAGGDLLAGDGGNDTLFGDAGNDTLFGDANNDSLVGGAVADTFWDGTGNDISDGGADADTFFTQFNTGTDTIIGGETGDDNDALISFKNVDSTLDLTAGGTAADNESGTLTTSVDSVTFSQIETITLSSGDDMVIGSDGDDVVNTDAGEDTVDGGAGNDTFNLGSDGVRDIVILSDGDGSDTISNFDMTDSGDGSTIDQVNVSALTSDGGTTPVTTANVVITDTNGDGSGDAILTFTGGESITLVGVAPSQVDTPAELEAIGIPAAPEPVDGTAGNDTMNVGFTDVDGDQIDGTDGINDTIYGYAGNDSINAGSGDDTVYGGTGNDTLIAGSGADVLYGDAGDDNLRSGTGDSTLIGGEGSDRLFIQDTTATHDVQGGDTGTDNDQMQFSSPSSGTTGVNVSFASSEAGTFSFSTGGGSGTFTGIETVSGTSLDDTIDLSGSSVFQNVQAGNGDDTITNGAGGEWLNAGSGADSIFGGAGNDTLTGDSGNDTLTGGDGDDSLRGGTDDDLLRTSAGADTLVGEGGDDTFSVLNGFGNGTAIDGGNVSQTAGDTLDLSATTTGVTVDLTAANSENGSFSAGTSTATFAEIENIILGGGRDTIELADGSGADIVQSFDMTDSGDGTTNDQLDVSGLTSDGGTTPVTTANVTVTDTNGDGSGDAILTFTGGESITLVGVTVSQVDTPTELESIGIPAALDFIVEGTTGADTIDASYTGDPEGDMIDNLDHSDGSNDDSVEGYGGNDSIRSGLGNDSVDAGTGDDTVFAGAGDDLVFAASGENQFNGEAGNDTLIGGTDRDNLRGGDDEDSLLGNEGADWLWTGAGNDTAFGGTGADLIYGETGNDSLLGEAGNDSIFGGDDNDFVDGGADNDWVLGGSGDDTIEGGSGNDVLWGGADNDSVLGGSGDDTITGDAGADVLAGGANDDSIDGGTGNDTLLGDSGADVLLGQAGDDVLFGGTENDTLEGGGDNDSLYGGTGNDSVLGQDGDDILSGEEGADTIQGGDGADLIHGGDDGDTIFGDTNGVPNDAGSDTIYGGTGNDSIAAGALDDIVIAGDGADTVYGDAGNDMIFGDEPLSVEYNSGAAQGSGAGGAAISNLTDFPTDTFTVEMQYSGAGMSTPGPDDPALTTTLFSYGTASSPSELVVYAVSDNEVYDLSTPLDLTDTIIETGYVTVEVNGNSYTTSISSSSVIDGGQHSVAVTFDAAAQELVIFFDGTPAETIALIDATPIETGGTFSLGQGAGPQGGFTGEVFDARLWDDIRTNAEINDYSSGTLEEEAGDPDLISNWVPDPFTGNFRDDVGGNVLTSDGATVNTQPGFGDDLLYGGDGSDTILGAGGNDTLDGDNEDSLGGADYLDGGDGNDQIIGDVGNDTLLGGSGADTIYAGADDDIVQGGSGSDSLFGGAGSDTIDAGGDDGAADRVYAGDDRDHIYATKNDSVDGGAGGEDWDTLHVGGPSAGGSINFVNLGPDSNGNGIDGYIDYFDSVGTFEGRLNFEEIEAFEGIICFTKGAGILTETGYRPVESLQIGDLVHTRDNGMQQIRWIGQRSVPGIGQLAPISFAPEALEGATKPLIVSPQHRMLLTGYQSELLFGETEVLVPAKYLVNGTTVREAPCAKVSYYHVMFDSHEVIYADGQATESFHAGGEGLNAIAPEAREEMFAIFPELRWNAGGHGDTARICLKSHEAQVLGQLRNAA